MDMSELSPTSHHLAKKTKQKRPNPQQRRRREAYKLARIAAELEAPGGLEGILNVSSTTATTATAVEECLREQTSSVRCPAGIRQNRVTKKTSGRKVSYGGNMTRESAAEHEGAEAAGSTATASVVTATAYDAPTGAEVITAEVGGSAPTSVPNRKIRRLRERSLKATRGGSRSTGDEEVPGAAGAKMAGCSSGRKQQTSGEAHAARRARLRKQSSLCARVPEAATMQPKAEGEDGQEQQGLNASSLWEAFLKADGDTQSLVHEALHLSSHAEKKAEGQRMTLPNTTTGETGAKKSSNPGSVSRDAVPPWQRSSRHHRRAQPPSVMERDPSRQLAVAAWGELVETNTAMYAERLQKVQATANSSLEMKWRDESAVAVADKEATGKRSDSESRPKTTEPRPPAASWQVAPHLRARLLSDPRPPVVETSCYLRKKVTEYITIGEDLDIAPPEEKTTISGAVLDSYEPAEQVEILTTLIDDTMKLLKQHEPGAAKAAPSASMEWLQKDGHAGARKRERDSINSLTAREYAARHAAVLGSSDVNRKANHPLTDDDMKDDGKAIDYSTDDEAEVDGKANNPSTEVAMEGM
ncbi:hypothetical protein BZA05DRAFT_442813 [Tricharina praecox]|uniref:uncharacterized protein n=1 Tax=Tricharina praecox TaxID=43433 RepID=UPI00221FF701|nr:uncharacterized protein BZA05DRAFT_442813 [Tricharina praecox]KAI5855152.1 hypothetical protein BZA05DRAFT_442813 [Tricharina praecox]